MQGLQQQLKGLHHDLNPPARKRKKKYKIMINREEKVTCPDALYSEGKANLGDFRKKN